MDRNGRGESQSSKYVICLECKKPFRRLDGGHLKAAHQLSAERYLDRWPSSPITCSELRENASRRTKKQMDSVRGKPRPALRSVRGHQGTPPLKGWPVVCGVVQGKSYATLGSALQRDFGTIADCARKRGISGKPCLYDFGQPFDKKAFQWLKRCTGLSAHELSAEVGVPEAKVTELMRPHRASSRVQVAIAKRIVAWRDSLITRLLQTVSKPDRGRDRYSGSRILLTFFPNLGDKHKLLGTALHHLRDCLNGIDNATSDQIGEYLCSKAMFEVARKGRRRNFASFLPWAPNLMPFLVENVQRIKGPGNLWTLADEAMAQRWRTTGTIVNSTRKSRVFAVPPKEMRWLILSERTVSESREPKRHPGRPAEPEEQKSYFGWGQRVENEIPAGLKQDTTTIINARRLVARNSKMPYDTIVLYHQRFRKTLKQRGQSALIS